MTDISRTEKLFITEEHIKYMGFSIEVLQGRQKSAIVCKQKGFKNITRNKKDLYLWYDIDGKEAKKLVTEKDLNDIVIPILNAKIRERNSALANES